MKINKTRKNQDENNEFCSIFYVNSSYYITDMEITIDFNKPTSRAINYVTTLCSSALILSISISINKMKADQ